MPKNIIILGAGIGGLTAAHELSKHANYNITIIEKNTFIGTYSKISHNNSKGTIWDIIAKNSKYFLAILDEITAYDTNVDTMQHLIPISEYIYSFSTHNNIQTDMICNNIIDDVIAKYKLIYQNPIPIKDKLRLKYIYKYARYICEDKLQTYDRILWKDHIKHMTANTRSLLNDIILFLLRMDPDSISTYAIFKLFRTDNDSNSTLYRQLYMFNINIKEKIFTLWKSLLESRGVKFILQTEVVKIHYMDLNSISAIDVKNILTGEIYILNADIFINNLNANIIGDLYPTIKIDIINDLNIIQPCATDKNIICKMLRKILVKNSLSKLYNASYTPLIQVIFYDQIDYMHSCEINTSMVILPDSPWKLCLIISNTTNDIICNIGKYNAVGSNSRCVTDCTPTDVAIECLHQIISSNSIFNIKPNLNNWNLCSDVVYDQRFYKLINTDPMFSYNVKTLSIRVPYTDENILNLYHATVYAGNNVDLCKLESGAMAGLTVANLILKELNITSCCYKIKDCIASKESPTKKINYMRKIDHMLYKSLYKLF